EVEEGDEPRGLPLGAAADAADGAAEAVARASAGGARKGAPGSRGGGGDERRIKHVEAIVLSMTPDERADPSVLNGSRRLRIAKGAGRSVQDVNRLLEQFQQMRKLLKRI